MHIDWSLNLGHLLTILGFAIGGMIFAFDIRSSVSSLKEHVSSLKEQETTTNDRLEAVERDMRRMNDVLVLLARQDERLTAHGQRLLALEQKANSG